MDNPRGSRLRYRAVFVSPHLDDAVFSCGGAMAQLLRQGPVLVLNVFTGYLGDLKIHGAVLGEDRHSEEATAAAFMGFESRNLGELDAPFRRIAYRQIGNLFRPPVVDDLVWLPTLRKKVLSELAEIDYDHIYVPLGIGWHVDHVMTHLLFDSWVEPAKLLYYEDASYCWIPHATRYRLDDIATYGVNHDDQSLLVLNGALAWWQAASAYANTALMKNLRPWYMRWGAVPVVGIYLLRLMASHRRSSLTSGKRRLSSRVTKLTAHEVACKVDAMAIYDSQFTEFFSSKTQCAAMLTRYAMSVHPSGDLVERFWVQEQFEPL